MPESRNNAPAAQTQAPPSTNSLNIPRDGNNTAQISGTVIDVTGAPVEGAQVSLLDRSGAPVLQVLTDEVGRFSFSVSAPGSFRLKVAAEGFETLTIAGELHAGENYNVPPLTLKVATEVTEVHVAPTQAQIAEDQIKQQEKQRVFGVVPNFYVTYLGDDTAPLTPKQKFELAWRTTIDPVTFIITGAVAGVQQASNFNSGYGQGAQGYGKRFGASYADLVAGTFIGGAILPSLLKQDPRYFYKGTGTFRSRALYAIANSVICKGDNKRWQVNYSNILGSLAAGGISNLYYPAQNRNGVGLTFENALIGIGATAAANLLQEFVVRKITPNLPSTAAGKTQSPVSKVLTVIEREGF
ncbi:MAG TPA: carboxypeptidase-like regulatory domain-containing protein [Candidatus Acidoferrum sp.]|nr:carboxypeptidase-like regulatory domain-containing protein [Candidatus Acidoferrum sp.]